MKLIENTSVLILAAGESVRMKKPKFMLKYDGKFTFLERIYYAYQKFGFDEIKIVLNPTNADLLMKSVNSPIRKEQIVINPFPKLEKFLSIQTGLKEMKKEKSILIHPVDNPCVLDDVINKLLENQDKGDFQIPEFMGKGGHPILISSKIMKSIIQQARFDMHFKEFLKSFNANRVKVENPEVLYNINTEQDYNHFISQMKITGR